MSDYLTDYKSRTNNVKIELDLTKYAIVKQLESTTHVDTSSFALKTNLASLKTEVDKLEIPKLSTLPTDVATLSNKVANDLAEETYFKNLKKKVDKKETKEDNLETKVNKNDSTTKRIVNNLKPKVDGIDWTKYVKKVITTLKLVI